MKNQGLSPPRLRTKPSFAPTSEQRRQVEAMIGYGVPQDEVAKTLGIAPHTLRKHFRAELDTAMTRANAAVAQSLYKKSLGNGPQSVTAAIFWLKTRCGWRETIVSEISGPRGGPIKTEDTSARKLIASRIASLAARNAAPADSDESE